MTTHPKSEISTSEIHRTSIVVPGKPVAAPRMTGRSQFAPTKRAAIERYHNYRDAIRLFAKGKKIPPAEQVERVMIIAIWRPPPSWSKKKQAAAMGTRKRTKPDPDNVAKSVLDALWTDDERLGDVSICRQYGEVDQTLISIEWRGES